jgi:hypothetical protein
MNCTVLSALMLLSGGNTTSTPASFWCCPPGFLVRLFNTAVSLQVASQLWPRFLSGLVCTEPFPMSQVRYVKERLPSASYLHDLQHSRGTFLLLSSCVLSSPSRELPFSSGCLPLRMGTQFKRLCVQILIVHTWQTRPMSLVYIFCDPEACFLCDSVPAATFVLSASYLIL